MFSKHHFTLFSFFPGMEKGAKPLPKWVNKLFLQIIAKKVGVMQTCKKVTYDQLCSLKNKNEVGDQQLIFFSKGPWLNFG